MAKKPSTELPSMKLKDLLAPRNEPIPVAFEQQTQEQRAVLRAFWRAHVARFVGGITTIKSVADAAQEDYGYGTVPRNRIADVLHELVALGFKLDVSDLHEHKGRKRKVKDENEVVVPAATVTPPPKPAAPEKRVVSRGARARELEENEVPVEVELVPVKLKRPRRSA